MTLHKRGVFQNTEKASFRRLADLLAAKMNDIVNAFNGCLSYGLCSLDQIKAWKEGSFYSGEYFVDENGDCFNENGGITQYKAFFVCSTPEAHQYAYDVIKGNVNCGKSWPVEVLPPEKIERVLVLIDCCTNLVNFMEGIPSGHDITQYFGWGDFYTKINVLKSTNFMGIFPCTPPGKKMELEECGEEFQSYFFAELCSHTLDCIEQYKALAKEKKIAPSSITPTSSL